MALTIGECRLFLLSDCIKYFKDAEEFTTGIRKAGKSAVLTIGKSEQEQINAYLNDEDRLKIRGMFRKEWKFTGKVIDLGKGNKHTCDYCQHQQIRYKYLCVNTHTNEWLEVGSVCVGYIVHGERKMKDEEFARKFVGDLDGLKRSATKQRWSEEDIKLLRKNQAKDISITVRYLYQQGVSAENNKFIASLQEQWDNGRALTDNQLQALFKIARNIKNKRERESNGV